LCGITPLQTNLDVPAKVIVLSGSGGVGTEAAARAVVDQYRDLEPRDQEPVWGVVEVLYRKSAGSTTCELVSYRWRYRVNGRCPIDFAKKKR
jgi:hypothetical protein